MRGWAGCEARAIFVLYQGWYCSYHTKMDRLRHFIRHGKAAKFAPSTDPDSSEKSASPMALSAAQVTPATVAGTMAVPTFTSPAGSQQSLTTATPQQAYSDGNAAPVENATSIHKQVEQIVAQERQEASSELPQYPGLPEQFELLEKLGDGTFSVVYKAFDHSTGKKVAVKIVRKQPGTNEQANQLNPALREHNRATERDAIMKEVQIMRRMRHPSIVQLVSFTESPEYCFMVLELLEGGELFEQIVKLTYLSEPLARHVIVQVAQGIQFMHEECGIVHRDIKPENLLFESIDFIPSKNPVKRPYDEDKEDEGEFRPGIGGGGIGRVKIADFGLSKIVWERNTKTPCGTVGYAAPEIVRDEHYSKSVDMWALGCVLYTLLCGFPPFYDESIKTLTDKVSKGEYTFLSPWWDDISDSAKDLVANLLTVDAKKRYTIDQFLAHEWCRQGEPAPSEPAPREPAPRATKPGTQAAAQASVHARRINELERLDSPLLVPPHRQDYVDRIERTSNANRLREAFDVSSAVHRIEEETRQKMRVSPEAQRDHVWCPINDHNDDARGDVANARIRYGNAAAHAIAERRHAQTAHARRSPAPNARQGFNLHLDGATILERRKRAMLREGHAKTGTAEPELPAYTADALMPIPSGAA